MMIGTQNKFIKVGMYFLGLLVLMGMMTTGVALAAPVQEDVVASSDEFVDWFEVAAEAIGIDDDALFDEVLAGKSIAEVAAEKGVDAQTVIDAIVKAETEWINQAVTDGEITQEEADEWLKYLPEAAKDFVEDNGMVEVLDCDDDECDWVDWFAVAAEAIGIDDEALFETLEAEKSIADIAIEKGVEVQKVIDAIVKAETEWINQAVTDGEITQEEADEWLKYLPEDAKAFVEEKGLIQEIDCEEDECDFVDWFLVAAEAIGIDDDTLFDEILAGKSIAQVATEKGVDVQTVIDAIVKAETEWINKAVADGEITQEEADEWLKYLPEDAKAFVEMNLSE